MTLYDEIAKETLEQILKDGHATIITRDLNDFLMEPYSAQKEHKDCSYKNGEYTYKGYKIVPTVMCFDIRYVVYGPGLWCNKYVDMADAIEAIDKYLAKTYVNGLLNQMSSEAGVTKAIMIEALKEILRN